MTDESDHIAKIERQLDKLEGTATNLETLSVLATREGKNLEAKSLSDQAVDLRIQQFRLYRNKHRIDVGSNEWQALKASLEVVNHFIEESMNDLKSLQQVLDAAAQLISIATKVAIALA